MIKECIGTGKTVELATQEAKLALKAPAMADLKVEVIQQPKKGFLGIGSKDAQVRVSYDDGKKEPKKNNSKPKQNKKQQQNKPVKKDAPKKVEKAEKPAPQKKDAPVDEAPAPKAEPKKDYPESVDLEYAKAYLAEIIKGLKVDDVKIEASYENGVITMDLECDDYGIIIGRRGETLDSIQYLLSLAMKKSSTGYVRATINVGNYREKRNETLKHLAHKSSSYVLRTGKSYTFEPMNPYERRVIHTTVQEIEGVESRSIGFNQDRRVVLEPTGGVKHRSNNNRRGNSKPAQPADPNREKKVDRADVPKFGKIEIK